MFHVCLSVCACVDLKTTSVVLHLCGDGWKTNKHQEENI